MIATHAPGSGMSIQLLRPSGLPASLSLRFGTQGSLLATWQRSRRHPGIRERGRRQAGTEATAATLPPPPPPFAPLTPPTVWAGWAALSLAAYVTYWLVLRRVVPRGKPAVDLIDKQKNPAGFRLFVGVALVELAVVFLLPWAAAAASGLWAAAAQFFAPIAVMTALNIALEGLHRKQGYVLAVYSSTGANNLWRLCAYAAALWEVHASAAAVGGAGAELAALAAAAPLRALAWVGVVVSIGIVLIFEPVVAAAVPLAQQPGGGDGAAFEQQ